MNIAAPKIPPEVLSDMFYIYDKQPWIRKRTNELSELWNICTSREQQILLKDLITDFYMFGDDQKEDTCNAINTQIQEWKLQADNTWIVGAANLEEVDGSGSGLNILKNKVIPYEDWHSRFISNIPAAAKKVKNGNNVILFDDFIGTGGKFTLKLRWFEKELEKEGVTKIKFFIVSFAAMELGIEHLRNSLKIDIFSSLLFKQGISDRYVGKELEKNRNLMKEIESQLSIKYQKKKLEEYSFGYKGTEALYCERNGNCPNNVFPIFWWPIKKDKSRFSTLLTRAG